MRIARLAFSVDGRSSARRPGQSPKVEPNQENGLTSWFVVSEVREEPRAESRRSASTFAASDTGGAALELGGVAAGAGEAAGDVETGASTKVDSGAEDAFEEVV